MECDRYLMTVESIGEEHVVERVASGADELRASTGGRQYEAAPNSTTCRISKVRLFDLWCDVSVCCLSVVWF